MAEQRRVVLLALGWALSGLLFSAAAAPAVSAAPTWWVAAPGAARSVSQIASNSQMETLGISQGVAGWLDPLRDTFQPVGPEPEAAFVAVELNSGLVLYSDGRLVQTARNGSSSFLQQLVGAPRGLAVGQGRDPQVVALTSVAIYRGRLGSALARLATKVRRLGPRALAAPVAPGQPFVVATRQGIFLLLPNGSWRRSPGAPQLGGHAALAQLGDGEILAADQRGLVWALDSGGWQPVFQILPFGGLGGVPRLTALAGVGPTAAYVATMGFGTLLTPDGGYSWYRAPPPGGGVDVIGLATLGPVFAPRPSGIVVAATSSGLFLHRLQTLPAPPVYSGQSQSLQLLGTAAVTVAAAVLVVALLLWERRRQRRRLFV